VYFEGQDNELAAFGYNRDGKRGKQQMVAGLLTCASSIFLKV
jgi:transposase